MILIFRIITLRRQITNWLFLVNYSVSSDYYLLVVEL